VGASPILWWEDWEKKPWTRKPCCVQQKLSISVRSKMISNKGEFLTGTGRGSRKPTMGRGMAKKGQTYRSGSKEPGPAGAGTPQRSFCLKAGGAMSKCNRKKKPKKNIQKKLPMKGKGIQGKCGPQRLAHEEKRFAFCDNRVWTDRIILGEKKMLNRQNQRPRGQGFWGGGNPELWGVLPRCKRGHRGRGGTA